MATLINASISENGDTGWNGNAKAGDQTGKEVRERSWYSKPWTFVLRYRDRDVANRAARLALVLAESPLVGYDQSQRNTLYKALSDVHFDVDYYLTCGKPTETDCSAFVYAVYACVIPDIRSDRNAPTTAEMKDYYSSKGFSVLTDPAMLNDGMGLLPGDVLVKPSSHTAIVWDEQHVTDTDHAIEYLSVLRPSDVKEHISYRIRYDSYDEKTRDAIALLAKRPELIDDITMRYKYEHLRTRERWSIQYLSQKIEAGLTTVDELPIK